MPAKAGIHYAAASRSIIAVSGILDPRLRGDDGSGGGAPGAYRRTLKKSLSSVAASVSPTAEYTSGT
jgi:hypothetical protein